MRSHPKAKKKCDSALISDAFEDMPMGVMILDQQGKILMLNRWQEKISKIRREEVIGTYFHTSWSGLFAQGFMGPYWDMIHRGKPYEMIVDRIKPQFYEQKVTAILRGKALSSGNGFVLVHEVSEEIKRDKILLEKLASQLAESRNFLANLIDSSPNAVVTVDSEGIIKSFNRTGERIFGYERGELVGRHSQILFSEPMGMERFSSLSASDTFAEALCKKRNGEVFPAHMRVSDILNRKGLNLAKLLLIADITRQREIEERLAVSEKLAIYSELMAGIAHQINNPLVGVVNFSALLLDRISREDPNRSLVETVNDAANQCQRILSSFMKSINEPRSTFLKTDIGEVLRDCLTQAKALIKGNAKGPIMISSRIHNKFPPIIGDKLQMCEVFRNLITNSIEAIRNQGKISVRSLIDRSEKEVKILISDSGIGIPKENLKRIFLPFFSGKKPPGSGLGLSLAYQVIKSHGGRIEVKSRVNRGTTFIVSLPYEDS